MARYLISGISLHQVPEKFAMWGFLAACTSYFVLLFTAYLRTPHQDGHSYPAARIAHIEITSVSDVRRLDV